MGVYRSIPFPLVFPIGNLQPLQANPYSNLSIISSQPHQATTSLTPIGGGAANAQGKPKHVGPSAFETAAEYVQPIAPQSKTGNVLVPSLRESIHVLAAVQDYVVPIPLKHPNSSPPFQPRSVAKPK